jgi:hypothetical protein
MKLLRRACIIVSLSLVATGAVALDTAASAAARSAASDAKVTVGAPRSGFPRNKQNEPSVGLAANPLDPRVLVAGSNEEIDEAPCAGSDCSFTAGVTDNGLYISLDAGKSWTEPSYTGWSARSGTARVGPIGTVPWYFESGLEGDGDPATAFGPRPGPAGFSWNNGARLYYASLASNFPGSTTIRGAEAISLSRTDDVRAAARGSKQAWSRPVIVSGDQTETTFSDKDAVWADNATSSKFFGYTYVCWTSYKDVNSPTTPAPIELSRSKDGGEHWSAPALLSPSVATSLTTGTSGCTIRTDSRGTVYVFWESANLDTGRSQQVMARSEDGGLTFGRPRVVADVIEVGKWDPVHVANGDPRRTMDGIAGARTGSDPSADIANGAPTGRGATNEIVLAWADGRRGLNHEAILVQTSRDHGGTWSEPVNAAAQGDRPNFPAVAIAPNGTNAYVVYDAFLDPWRQTTSTRRLMQAVVRRITLADENATARTLYRAPAGDARGSSENNLCCEFLGDYNYAVADNESVFGVWNDVRDAAVCPAMNAYRQSFLATTRLPKPEPAHACPPTFGNSDIFGGRFG